MQTITRPWVYIEEIGGEALGYFTIEEAAKFLETNQEQLGLELDSAGHVVVNGYSIQYDE